MLDRRRFMTTASLLGATLTLPTIAEATARAARPKRLVRFPKDFVWGTATSSYQIEGSVNVDGRGKSIWDTFSHTPGKIRDGSNGDVACDSYRRWREDVALIKSLGLKSYRFSIAWPRIQADGTGAANQKGLDYYRGLIDGLLEVGIRPLPTLYHWDLPQALQDKGGWPERDTASRFADYARITTQALGDRTPDWCIFNEPSAFTGAGHKDGIHAPGLTDTRLFLKSTHTVNLAYGMAYRAIKSVRPDCKMGNAINVSAVYAATDSAKDKEAARRFDNYVNLWFLHAAKTGTYPDGVLPPDQINDLLGIRDGDSAIMKTPYDFLGINYYTPFRASDAPNEKDVFLTGLKAEWATARDGQNPKSDIGWRIYPVGFTDVLKRVNEFMGGIPIEILENGGAFNDKPGPDGRIRDIRRIAFLDDHLRAMHDAMTAGVPVRAYHHWSLMDNFEWGEGYSQRFGMVFTDYDDNQKRIVKDSGNWFAAVAARNGLLARR
jgi:beta-glucosidase